MITAHDVNTVTFQKAMRGYRAEDVDKLLDDVAGQLEADATELEALKKANEELKANMYLLAQKIETYRTDEENLKSALINAQRMGENVIREAKQKADGILRDAAVRAEGIVQDAQQEYAEQTIELKRVKAEVGQFKADVLSLYKRHIETLSTLPEAEETELEELQEFELAQEEVAQQVPEVQTEPETEPEQTVAQVLESAPVQGIPEATPEEFTEGFVPDASVQEAPVDAFWAKDEAVLKEAAPAPEKEASAVFQAFKGIKFSD